MKETRLEIKVQELNVDELSPLEVELMSRAVAAAKDAYAPYSHFHVGAAVMLTNGRIITGNNQENAAYPSGLCAERVAVFNAVSQYPNVAVREIALVAIKNGAVTDRISPCGACRQVLFEAEQRGNAPVRVMMCGKEKVQVVLSIGDLLPLSFGSTDLK